MKDLDLLRGVADNEEYMQYLQNMIFHYSTLQLTSDNAKAIKQYAEELEDILYDKECDDLSDILQEAKLELELDKKPVEKTSVKSGIKFNVGDRVSVRTDRICGKKYDFGTVVLIEDAYNAISQTYYLIELDDRNYGWTATVKNEGIDCNNVWRAKEHSMVLVKDILQKDKWYDCHDFTVEQLEEILPNGTAIQVSPLTDEEETSIAEKILDMRTVDCIISYNGVPVIALSDKTYRRHFKYTGGTNEKTN